MTVYCIPGLGFDHRIFQYLDPGPYPVQYLDWIEPEKDEPLAAYAARLTAEVDDEQPITLIGHSFGGMVSQVIATQKRVALIILVSSIRSRCELPLLFKLVKPLQLDKLVSRQLILGTFPFWARMQDYASVEEQTLFRSMVSARSNHCLRWAVKALSTWEAPLLPAHTSSFQIHGRRDRTLPFGLLQSPDLVLDQAGHFMIFKHAGPISVAIQNERKKTAAP